MPYPDEIDDAGTFPAADTLHADRLDGTADPSPPAAEFHSRLHADLGAAIIALETLVGVTSSADTASLVFQVTQALVDIALRAPKDSPVFTTQVTVPSPPVNSTDAAPKGYVDTADALRALIANAVFTGTNPILPGNPVGALEAVPKQYADGIALGFSAKAAVATATTANITLSGEQTIDGVLTSASRVLVKNQSTASNNGIYVSASGAWARATDMDAGTEVPGAQVFVTPPGSPNTNGGSTWATIGIGPFTLGSTAIVWTQTNAPGQVPAARQIIAGTGLAGGGDLSADRTLSMPNVGTAGTYGDSTHVPQFQTDAQGRITSVSNQAIAAGVSTVDGQGGDVDLSGSYDAFGSADTARDDAIAASQPVDTNLTLISGSDAVAFGRSLLTLADAAALRALAGLTVANGQTFSFAGTALVAPGKSRWYPPVDATIANVIASADTAPTDADLIIDVLKNGTSIFTTTANRPTIADGTNVVFSLPPDVTDLVAGSDYLTVDVVQVGATEPGSDLDVQIVFV